MKRLTKIVFDHFTSDGVQRGINIFEGHTPVRKNVFENHNRKLISVKRYYAFTFKQMAIFLLFILIIGILMFIKNNSIS